MKFATVQDDTLDGRLLLVSRDHTRCMAVPAIAPSLLHALQHWDAVEADLLRLYDRLNGDASAGTPFDPLACIAPLPRSPQWCDGSAFLNHANLMAQAFNTAPIPDLQTIPLM